MAGSRAEPGRRDLLGGQCTADHVPFGFKFGSERGVAGEPEDLELAVGTVALLDHTPPVAVELARAYDPDDGGAVA